MPRRQPPTYLTKVEKGSCPSEAPISSAIRPSANIHLKKCIPQLCTGEKWALRPLRASRTDWNYKSVINIDFG